MSDYCAYPTLNDSPEKKKAYLEKLCKWQNRFRLHNMYRMGLNLWFYRGAHWLKAPRDVVTAGNGFRFERDETFGNFRQPVDNYIATNVDNAVARFLRKQYKPVADAEKNLPELLAAARLGTQIIEHDSKAKDWKTVQQEMAFDFETVGIAIGKSWWDENHLDMVPIAATDAVICPSCEGKLASPKVPSVVREFGIPGPEGPMPAMGLEHAEEDETGLTLKVCPTCEMPSELKPYQVSPEESVKEQDVFGRPLGEYIPKGEPIWECVSWADLYPENAGVGVEPHNMKAWGQKTPRSVDWLMARFPEFGEIFPEPASELLRNHPTMGVNLIFQGGMSTVYDEGVFDSHAALLECHIDPMPYPGLEQGHSIYMVGSKVISKPLCVEVDVPKINGIPQEPRKVKLVQYGAARRKRIPKEFYGRTPVDDQIPLQRRLNRLDAQVEDIRERGGPTAFVPTDIQVYDRHREGAMNVVEYEAGDPTWNPKESLVNAQPLTGNAYLEERDRIVQALQRLGAQDVELGKNPVGAKTIGQLQILAEEAQQQRGTAEDDLKRLYERGWSHYLELKWAFQKEEATIEVEGAQNSYERQSYTGTNLLGQTRVRLEAKGSTDKQVLQQEIALKAAEMGLYDLTTISAKEEFLEILQAPKIDAAKSMQVERANQAWLEFKQDGRIPVFDETTGNPLAWGQTLGNAWLSDEALQMQREADWNSVVRGIAGWRRYYDQAVMQDEQQRAVYEGQDPSQWQAIYQQGSATLAQAQQAAASATAAGIQAAPPTMTSFPAPPQSGTFLPNGTDQKLLQLWSGMLGPLAPNPQVTMMLVGPMQRKAALRDRLLRMYAVIVQCDLVYEEKQKKAMMAQVQAPPAGDPGMAEAAARGAA